MYHETVIDGISNATFTTSEITILTIGSQTVNKQFTLTAMVTLKITVARPRTRCRKNGNYGDYKKDGSQLND